MKRETEEKRNVIKAAMERIVQRLFTIIFLISIMAFQPSLGQQAKNLKDSPIKFYPNHHKKDKDTLQQWMSKFYTLGTMKISKNNRWVMLNKIYKRNNDTVLVFDSTKPDQVIHTIIKRPQNFFLGSGYILTSGNGKAEFLDVKMNQKKVYENIQRAEVLNKSNQYFILDKNKNLSLYDKNAKLIHSTSGVADYVSDKKSKIFVSEKLEKMKNTMVSVLLNDKKSIDKETLYSTENEITKLELIPSGKYVTVTEKIRDSDLLQITFVETGTRSSTIKKNFKSFSGKADFVMVSEIQNGNSYLIDFDKRIPLVKEEMVEIWYGTDKKLREKKYGSQQHQYLLWNPKLNESVKLPTDQFSSYASIGSDRYFLAFNSDEEFNYTSGTHLYSMHLYDKLMGSSERIFTKTYRIIVSPDGRYISAYDEKIKGWVLYDTLESAFIPVKNKGKLSPVFSSDNQFVLFESENDLWQMDLKTKEVKRLNIAPNQDVKISNLITETLFRQFNVSVELRAVDLQKPMLLKVRDKERNLTSCINWKKGKSEVIIPPSQNRIKDFKYNEGGNSIFSIEENYNSPPVLYRYSNKGAVKTQIFRSGKEDKIIKNLKQEILSYTNTAETPLKGMLYYPIGFNLNKKYPMVVRIYQQQSESSGIYPIPDYDEDGFNLRLLLENGYFVFLPDIIYDERGTGVSALDCVNSGLDQLITYPNIDQKKIGLTGHSMGGYETNFIATKSDRFVAYLSGASISNIVKSYFSFNTHFSFMDYARLENGQYEMNVPFSENKEKYFKNNPIHDVEKVSAPMLLWAGTKDQNVTPDQTMAFFAGLVRNRKPVIALMYPHREHDLGIGSEESKDLNLKTLDWWRYFLKDEKNIPWIEKEMNQYERNQ